MNDEEDIEVTELSDDDVAEAVGGLSGTETSRDGHARTVPHTSDSTSGSDVALGGGGFVNE